MSSMAGMRKIMSDVSLVKIIETESFQSGVQAMAICMLVQAKLFEYGEFILKALDSDTQVVASITDHVRPHGG
jgi:hypothetical protein